MPDLSTLSGYINQSSGFARPNRFVMNIDITRLFQQMKQVSEDPGIFSNSRVGERLQYFCTRAELPSKAFEYFEQGIYGPPIKMPYSQRFQDISLEFVVGNDMFERKFFDLWQLFIADPNTNDLNYHNDYITNITISQWTEIADNNSVQGTASQIAQLAQSVSALGRIPFTGGIAGSINNITKLSSLTQEDGTSYSITLIDAWPVEVTATPLSYDEMDSHIRMVVTFAYKKWIPTQIMNGGNLFPTKPASTMKSGPLDNIMRGYASGLTLSNTIQRAVTTPTTIIYDEEEAVDTGSVL